MASPILTITGVTRTRISHVSGIDSSTVTFTSDQDLTDWEARAGGTGRGSGLLVGAATGVRNTWDLLSAGGYTWNAIGAAGWTWNNYANVLGTGVSGSFVVDDEELTQGDQVYRVDIYGKNAAGEWSTQQRQSVRYVRDWLNGSNANSGNHWVEIQAVDFGGTNVAAGKTVTTSGTVSSGSLTVVTDGNTASSPYVSITAGGARNVTVDLGSVYAIDLVKVWHYYSDGRTYLQTKTEVSADGVAWTTVYDSSVSGTYPETSAGRTYKI